MPHSFNKIWIHAVWSTKERLPLIRSNVEKKIHDHICSQFIEAGCYVRIVNGMPDHIHSLFMLNPQKSISEIIKHVKGGSSHWINEHDVIREKFAWQTGYAAYSVSESVCRIEILNVQVSDTKDDDSSTTVGPINILSN